MKYNKLKKECEIMIRIIKHYEVVEKADLNDLEINFDSCKDNILNCFEELKNE